MSVLFHVYFFDSPSLLCVSSSLWTGRKELFKANLSVERLLKRQCLFPSQVLERFPNFGHLVF